MAFKRWLLAGLLFAALPLRAGQQVVGGDWKGLNDGDSSMFIADNEAQSLLNVDLTDNGYGIKKRSGYAQFKTIGTSTWGVRGGYYFLDVNGNNTVVHANNRSIFESVNGAAYTAFVTTDTAGSYQDFTDSNGYLWRANSNRDEILKYDGSAVTYYPSHPKGTQIEAMPDRLVISGTSANPNRLYFSKAADFTTFTTGNEEADAFADDYGLPGQAVNAIKYACGRVLIWTKSTFGFWEGTNQFDAAIEDITTTVGSNQPSSIVTDLGVTYFQASDGHFYAYDCDSVGKISRKIGGSVAGFVSGDNKSWTVASQAEFGEGAFGTGLSSTTSPGDVAYGLEIEQDEAPGNGAVFVGNYLAQSFQPPATFRLSQAYAIFAQIGYGSTWTIRTDSSNSPSSTILSTAVLSASECTLYGQCALSFSPAVSLSANTTYWLYAEPLSVDMIGFSNTNPYSSGVFLLNGAIRSGDDMAFGVASSSSTYQSQAFNIGTSITSWGAFELSNVLNSGAIAYAIYGDSNTAITINDASTFVSSQTITSGSIPTIATAAYVTWAANYSRTISTYTPTVNSVTVNWNEGTITRSWGTVDKDHRIMWSVAEGTATAPNATYIYDPRFDSWLKYSAAFDAPARVGDDVYFGGVSTGVVYKWPSGNTDTGSAITAYWKSKDFISGDPFVEKDYTILGLIARTHTGSNLDIVYTPNTLSSTTDNFSLTDSDGATLKRINYNLPSGTFGTFFNIRFGNDDGDAPFEVYALRYDYEPRSWRVIPEN